MADKDLKGLPVHGYRAQPQEKVATVNELKQAEEKILRLLDDVSRRGGVDPRWYAVGRRHIEQGFMEINRSVFQPDRIRLPEDEG